jgi:dTDP-4-amino-4,6-dideoxygalactose transaminase
MSLHGISRDAWRRYAANGSWYYEIEDAGYKYNMTDIAAALGLVQLGRASELLAARRTIATSYTARFRASPSSDLLELPDDAPDGSHAWHLYIIRLQLDRLAIDRAAVLAAMADLGIGTSVHFIPLHLQPFYQRALGARPDDHPRATAAYRGAISLPLYPRMTEDDVDDVIEALRDVVTEHRR